MNVSTENRGPVLNLVRGGIAGFDGRLPLRPSLSHGTLDNVALNPFAFRAGKRPQILARRARLDRRQLHRGTASGALRTLVLLVQHGVGRQFGGLSSPTSQPAALDLKGSDALTSIST